ncbi:hypothetical protein ACFXO2_29900 [Streptomyces sp. NPDC059152]|uniref:hypothetical protein n=1 Tax=Streptomyces sp. NPDC059152 TaxID=3346742 RepID=UPI0036ABCE7A
MATVLGLSEPTVARRYRRMRRAGAIRVVGVVDPGALGQSRWMVRLRCRPGSATAIAEALAQRDDVGWVALGAAGSEVTCAVRSQSSATTCWAAGSPAPPPCSTSRRRCCSASSSAAAGTTGPLSPEP